MKLKDALGVVPIKETIMVIVYNNAIPEKFVGSSVDAEYQMAKYKYRDVSSIQSLNDILTIFVE